MTNKERMASLMAEPVRNMVHSFYDGFVEANAVYKLNSGVQAVIIRRQIGKCCDWCANLCGVFEYGNHPKDIFRRHDSCKCQVTYSCEKGNYTDVHSKKEFRSQRDARIRRTAEIEATEEASRVKRAQRIKAAIDSAEIAAIKKELRKLLSEGKLDAESEETIKKYLKGEISLSMKNLRSIIEEK